MSAPYPLTQQQIAIYHSRVKRELRRVQHAFYEDTKTINDRSRCYKLTISEMERIVNKALRRADVTDQSQ